jgi:hypothetical protein
MINKIQIQNWLAEEGMFKKEIPDDNSNFHFVINYPENHIIDLIQPKGKDDMILIGCATEIDPTQINLIKQSSNKDKQNFIWDIRLLLNNFLLDFELEHPNDILQRFVITDEIYEDGLSKNNLINIIKKVFKGKLQCIWKLNRTFNNNKEILTKNDNDNMYI